MNNNALKVLHCIWKLGCSDVKRTIKKVDYGKIKKKKSFKIRHQNWVLIMIQIISVMTKLKYYSICMQITLCKYCMFKKSTKNLALY